MSKTKKEKALNDILKLKTSWCLNKTANGGCSGCPMIEGGSIDWCLLTTLRNYIETSYNDNLEKYTLERSDLR